jgi:DNA-binding response OmpR family regulator
MNTILIAEDDLALAMILQKIFEEKGFRVYAADNGITAWEQYRVNKPQAALIDVEMPGKNGWEVLDQIREENQTIPIIIMSGKKLSKADSSKSYELGATSFIRKPFDQEELLCHINSLVNSIYGCSKTLYWGNIQLNVSSRILHISKNEYKLTDRENSVLSILIKNASRIVETKEFMNHIWHDNDCLQSNNQMLKNVITGLRKILEPEGVKIESVYNAGYRISQSAEV